MTPTDDAKHSAGFNRACQAKAAERRINLTFPKPGMAWPFTRLGSMNPIYLDHNASSPLDPEVLGAMQPYLWNAANAESRHGAGRTARRALEQAREMVAAVLGADPTEVIFTSGGTEANNLALLGQAGVPLGCEPAAPGILTNPLEHPAVSAAVGALKHRGWRIQHAPVSEEGLCSVDGYLELADEGTRLATLILAQNETGAIQPVGAVAQALADRGIPLHTDAVQAVGRIPVRFAELGVATLACSAHKCHGPPGIGALLIRRGIPLVPQHFGGNQERGLRPGTPAVALACGFARALELWEQSWRALTQQWEELRDRLEAGLIAYLGAERVVRHGPREPSLRLPQTSSIGFRGMDGNALLIQLDQRGLAVSLGSACASGSTRPSPALLAMGIDETLARASIRFSLGKQTTREDVEAAMARCVSAVRQIDAIHIPEYTG